MKTVITRRIITRLRIGAISATEAEIERQLRIEGVPHFQIEELKKDILHTYEKERYCR